MLLNLEATGSNKREDKGCSEADSFEVSVQELIACYEPAKPLTTGCKLSGFPTRFLLIPLLSPK